MSESKYFAWSYSGLTLGIAQRLLYKTGSRVEILAEVKGRDVFGYHAVVDKAHVAVVTSAGVHVVPGSLCRVQHVSNPQPLQIRLVLCGLPERRCL